MESNNDYRIKEMIIDYILTNNINTVNKAIYPWIYQKILRDHRKRSEKYKIKTEP